MPDSAGRRPGPGDAGSAGADLQVVAFDPDPDRLVYTFGGVEPAVRIAPGTIVKVFTEDCFAGRIRGVDDLFTNCVEAPYINPQTGPFEIAGAEPGDTLAVHFVDISPARDWAVSTTVPLFGALTATTYTQTLQEPLPERTWLYTVDRNGQVVTFHALDSDVAVDLPLTPFHGTVGVAPKAFEVRNTLVPEAFGGNMDTPEMRSGTTLYLGVNVPGAMLSLGDGHYTMGEGEACGVAVEGAMNTVFTVEVIKGLYCPWPRLEDDDHLMVAGSWRPLDDAFRIAHAEMVRWVAGDTGLSLMDAYQLVSQTARSPVANMCDTNYTVVAKVPKRLMPRDIPWMNDAHGILRRRARAYLASR
ncbi:MAG: acetamidase/formamidase family protein [Acidimicrobiales bacterium]